MSTGTIQSKAPQVITDLEMDGLQTGFTNASGGELTEGQEITLKTTGTVDKRTSGSEYPLGIVVVGAKDGERLTARINAKAIMNCIANGGTLQPGDFVIPTGTKNADNLPLYKKAVSDDIASAVVIKGATAGNAIKVAVLHGVVIIP